MSLTHCPSHEELRALHLGKLPQETATEIGEHLDACETCQATIDTISDSEDKLVQSLQQPAVEIGFEEEPELQEAIEIVNTFAVQLSSPTLAETGQTKLDDEPLGTLRDYELLEMLGAGGMGTVYKARHARLKRIVALKVLPEDRIRDERAVARFEREMEAVGKLEHPNIVQAHDAGENEGTHYLVMEYVDGLDLSQLVRRRGSLEVADACELVRQAAAGLQCAHEHGLVHRDVKPSNMMLTPVGQVKLLDLGLALLSAERPGVDDLTVASQMMGTADYCAPEQAGDSHAVDNRADIYSLGCTLFKLLVGEVPYGGPKFKSSTQKLLAHIHEPAPSLSERRAGLPDTLTILVERMMAKRPQERPATAAEVAAALAPFATGSNLPDLFSSVNHERDAAPANDVPVNRSRMADTDAYLSSAFHGTRGSAPAGCDQLVQLPSGFEYASGDITNPLSAAVPSAAPRKVTQCAGQKTPPRRRMVLAAAGAAAILLLGVVITVKMRDGSTRRFEIEEPVQEVTVTPTDDRDPKTTPDAEKEVVKWVFSVEGRVAVVSKENWGWPARWPERVEELPETFDGIMVSLRGCRQVADDDLKQFRSLKKPFWLDLAETAVSDAGLAALRDLPNLRFLSLYKTRITCAGLENLGTLPNLVEIELVDTATSGADLTLLHKFPKLTNLLLGPSHLNLRGVSALSSMHDVNVGLFGFGPADVKYLGELTDLLSLSGFGKKFGDACLEPLATLSKLKTLGLWDTSVSDAGVARLPVVAPQLLVLTIRDGRLTDDSVKHLSALKELAGLNLWETGITASGVARLRAALPDCMIQWTEKKQGAPAVDADRDQ